MDYYSSQISKLIQELSSLPGIGAKSAQRLAFHILNMPVEQVEELSSSIVDARKNVRYCKECFTLTDDELVHPRGHKGEKGTRQIDAEVGVGVGIGGVAGAEIPQHGLAKGINEGHELSLIHI